MKNKKVIRTVFMMLLVACLLLAYPTVAHAASASGDVGSSISNFFTGILNCLVMICEGVIGIFATLAQLLVDIVNLIIGLFN
ncbi:MAG: hypothetical protein E7453_05670 [Ruminococcaceae bacterium]|nr:hypothetical protein [Oscillospiraceae bacterium]